MAKQERRPKYYQAYRMGNDGKDPIIHEVHSLLDKEGVDYTKAAALSEVSRSTIVQWIEGKTLRPQVCTIGAVAGALGYEVALVKSNGRRRIA